MSYAKLLTNQCDIYHLKSETTDGGYGVPGETTYYYDETPDITGEACYFTEQSQTITQGGPNNIIVQSFLVHFLPTTDIRVNDKVMYNGIELILQVPMKVKNHHWEVVATRQGSL